MSEFKPCPFCGGEMRIVPLLGNCACYGVECETGPCPGSHINQTWPTAEEAVAALNRRAQPANEPLTLEQLREMGGEPVWCADGEGHSCYCLVNAESEDCIDSECGAWCFEFYGMTGDGENGLHNMGWLAYAHKPGGEQE